MGTFSITIEVGSADQREFRKIEALVDTGATFTWLPRALLEELGHEPLRTNSFELGDGRVVETEVGEVPIRIGNEVIATTCAFANGGERPVLGAVALEQFLLAPDPVNQRLVPVVGLHISRRSVQ